MLRARGGDRAAFGELLDRHETRIFGFAAKHLGERALAEEACQETFIRLWKFRDRYEPRGRFTAYISRLCLNACRELRRSRGRRRAAMQRFADQTCEQPVDRPDEDLLAQEDRRRIERAISTLPEKLKEAVLLRFYVGLSYPEMTAILGRKETTLRANVFHATKKLRPLLKEVVDHDLP